jgi:hypothetical protein
MNDPKIKVETALDAAGAAASLAEITGYSRARVYQWISEGVEYLPPLAAYRWKEHRRKASGVSDH